MTDKEKINGEINIGETIKSNIDFWKNKCFELENKLKELEIERDYYKKMYLDFNNYFIKK